MNFNNKIHTLFLDLGNVLVRYNPTEAIKHFSKHTPVPIDKIFTLILEDGLIDRFEEGRMTTKEFYTSISSLTKWSGTFDDFQDVWANMFYVNPFMEDVIKKLKGKYPLIMLSNTNELHFGLIRDTFPISDQMDEFVLSYKVGFIKPKKEIYLAAIETAGVEPEKCLFIDDREENCEGARSMGINTIQYTSDEDVARGFARYGIDIN